MFSFFKSQATRKKEMQVKRLGEELFRQISVFRDKCQSGELTKEIFKDRVNHAYTAGYMIGFVDEKLSKLFDSEADKSKYTTRIIGGIFPKSGVMFIKGKYEARVLAENLHSTKYVEKVEGYIDDFDIGMENGRTELVKWEHDQSYVPHLLTDFLMTSAMPQTQPKTTPDRNYNIAPFDAALKRLLLYHKACMLTIHNWEYPNEEKTDLATQLYFLGALDCASQQHRLSDMQFADFIVSFFHKIGVDEMYARFLGVFFVKMDSVPSAKKCIIEGGENFNKWLNGNSMTPRCLIRTLEKYCDDPNFPASVGHLYVKVEKL